MNTAFFTLVSDKRVYILTKDINENITVSTRGTAQHLFAAGQEETNTRVQGEVARFFGAAY